VLRGAVTAAGAPVRGADVFLLESLDGATTDTAGHFLIRTWAAGSVTTVVRRIGFAPANLVIPVDTAGMVTLALSPETAVLAPIIVQRYDIVMLDGSKILASRTRSRELRGLAI
jgi:CarboxypepD_reg-like domain